MKKLMVAAAIAFAAVAGNAATIGWGVNEGSVANVSGGTMYLVWASSAMDFSQLDSMASFNDSTIATIGGTVVDSETYAGGVQVGSEVVMSNTPIGTMGKGPRTFYSVIISADGDYFAYSASSSVTILDNTNSADISMTAGSYTVVPAAAAPEPTSGLLLLLGVAGLALKRRRA